MSLLFVANYGPRTGYAWNTIEAVFQGVGARFVEKGTRVYLAYAFTEPGWQAGEEANGLEVVQFDYPKVYRSVAQTLRFLRLLRRLRVTLLYLTDVPTWSLRYPLYRFAGVRRIVIHDRTSGTRDTRGGWVGPLKRWLHRLPLLSADRFIAVSQFVADRQHEVNGIPQDRIHCVYNGIDLSRFAGHAPGRLHELLGIAPTRPVVLFAGRMQRYKGIWVLLEAAEVLARQEAGDPLFVFCGDGPDLEALREEADRRALENVIFLGKRDDIPELLPSASVAVVPSIWAEAFGLAVVEPMAAGVPVVASRTGGIPELLDHGETGRLVTPGDAAELAEQVRALLADDEERHRLANRARVEVRARFSIDRTITEIHAILRSLLDQRESPGVEPSEVSAHPSRFEQDEPSGIARGDSHGPTTIDAKGTP